MKIECTEEQKEFIIEAIMEHPDCPFDAYQGRIQCFKYDSCDPCLRNEIEWYPEGALHARITEEET